jgi:hypothetical protein
MRYRKFNGIAGWSGPLPVACHDPAREHGAADAPAMHRARIEAHLGRIRYRKFPNCWSSRPSTTRGET